MLTWRYICTQYQRQRDTVYCNVLPCSSTPTCTSCRQCPLCWSTLLLLPPPPPPRPPLALAVISTTSTMSSTFLTPPAALAALWTLVCTACYSIGALGCGSLWGGCVCVCVCVNRWQVSVLKTFQKGYHAKALFKRSRMALVSAS